MANDASAHAARDLRASSITSTIACEQCVRITR
jgi:hypothetical protein